MTTHDVTIQISTPVFRVMQLMSAYVSDFNDAVLRLRLTKEIHAWYPGYVVQCDDHNNPPSHISEGKLTVRIETTEITLRPSKAGSWPPYPEYTIRVMQ